MDARLSSHKTISTPQILSSSISLSTWSAYFQELCASSESSFTTSIDSALSFRRTLQNIRPHLGVLPVANGIRAQCEH